MAGELSYAQKAAVGGAASYGARLARLVVQLGSFAVLGRLLTPGEFGLVALATVIGGAAFLLSDVGLSQASIQARVLTAQQRSNLFWLNTALGLVIGLALVCGAPLYASLVREPHVSPILQVLAVSYVMNAMAAQYVASLTRDLRFSRVASTDLVSLIVGVAVAIASAFAGLGAWSLVLQQVSQSLTRLVLAGAAARWLPGRYRRHVAGMRDLLTFGAHVLGVQVVNYVGNNAGTLMLGLRSTAHELGFYNRAWTLARMPIEQLGPSATRVAFPILSRLNGSRDYGRYAIRGAAIAVYSLGSISMAVGALAGPTVDLLLGADWDEAKPLVAIISTGVVFQTATYPLTWIFTSTAVAREQFRFTLVSRTVMVGLVFVGSLGGAVGVAIAVAASMVIEWALLSFVLLPRAFNEYRLLNANTARAIAFLLIGWPVCHFASSAGPVAETPIVAIMLGGLAFGLYATVGGLLLPHLWADFRTLFQTLHHLKR